MQWTSVTGLCVHCCQSDEAGFLTNAFLVETARGLVAVDAMMRVSDARRLRALGQSLGKPLLGVLLTHGHPDHYNGVGELLAGANVPVVATEGVEQVMRRLDDAREKRWRPVFGADWPAERTFPTHVIVSQGEIEFDGVRCVVRELGKGESHCDSYWLVGDEGRLAFIGDLVFSGAHSFMNDGHTSEWLAVLEGLERDLRGVEHLFLGHAEPRADLSAIGAQRRYLQVYRDEVVKLARGAPQLSEVAKEELRARMTAFLGSQVLSDFVVAGADAVALELNGG